MAKGAALSSWNEKTPCAKGCHVPLTAFYRPVKALTITCFGDQSSGTWLSLSDEDNSVFMVQTDNFVNVNVFNSVPSPCVLSYCCVLHYFLTVPVVFKFNFTFRLKPQVGGIKIATV